jgi:uncharacterized membrane protein YgdD (TMEM256/DUF423 family)
MNKSFARGLIALAALLLATATALGAVASHALNGVLDAAALHSFETGVHYQFFHSLGLMGLAIYAERQQPSRLWLLSAGLLSLGVLLFCGGVYASSLGGPALLARLAPTGGVALITGWLTIAVSLGIQMARDGLTPD